MVIVKAQSMSFIKVISINIDSNSHMTVGNVNINSNISKKEEISSSISVVNSAVSWVEKISNIVVVASTARSSVAVSPSSPLEMTSLTPQLPLPRRAMPLWVSAQRSDRPSLVLRRSLE